MTRERPFTGCQWPLCNLDLSKHSFCWPECMRLLRDMAARFHDAADEVERLTALKTPASSQLLNITKALLDDANAENEQLQAQVSRDNERYQAAMVMAEKHRKNWVEACQEREKLQAELTTVILRTGYHVLRPKP